MKNSKVDNDIALFDKLIDALLEFDLKRCDPGADFIKVCSIDKKNWSMYLEVEKAAYNKLISVLDRFLGQRYNLNVGEPYCGEVMAVQVMDILL